MASLAPVFKHGSVKDVRVVSEKTVAVEDGGLPGGAKGEASETFLMVPGLGDFRQSYRFLAPLLQAAGHRVLVADLRGHGGSSVGFPSYTPLDVANDIVIILDSFNITEPVILVGHSLSGSSVLKVAATHPARVKAVIGLAPVARDLPQDIWFRRLSYLLFVWPWGVPSWMTFYKSLFKSTPPSDLPEYAAAMKASLQGRGRLRAVAQFARGSKQPCFESAAKVTCPVLLIHGEKDPDFASPLKEAREVVQLLTSARIAKYEIVPDVGHYPYVEQPWLTSELMLQFLKDL